MGMGLLLLELYRLLFVRCTIELGGCLRSRRGICGIRIGRLFVIGVVFAYGYGYD
jgi:hypothetical protein